MEPTKGRPERLTRRDAITGSGGLIAGGLLAGCTGGGSRETAETSETTETSTSSETETPGSEKSYTVTMAPSGDIEFDAPPETWMAYFSTYGDMGIALGQLDGLKTLIYAENWPDEFYDYLPGVDVSLDGVEQIMGESGIDKEVFYEFDCDVHLFDPNFVARLDDSWEPADFDEIVTNVGPIVGNYIRRHGEDWHDYRYYSLYEAFGKIADVFRQRERYEALKALHDDFVAELRADLPPRDDRPAVGLLSVNSDFEAGSFYAYPVHDGNGHKQYRDLGIRGAFGPHIDGNYAQWDYEQLLEVDPDVLVFQYGFSHVSTEEFEVRKQRMRDDPVGRQLSAVRNGRLYRGGTSYQGPILHLFQTTVAAKQFYPDRFGEWHGLDTLANEGNWLFDHRRVADIVTGAL